MRSQQVKNNQSGFTLIELVVVIVILGILAVTALPKFVDLSGDARTAATQGVAGALGSASSINYATAVARGATGALASITPGTTGVEDTSGGCTTTVAASLMQAGVTFAPTGTGTYNISGVTSLTNVGDPTPCTVINNDDPSRTATFTLLGAK